MIYFFGDVHGKFTHVQRAVEAHRPDAIIFLGDIQAQRPLHEELEKVMDKTEVWFIHGNHDTDSETYLSCLTDSKWSERNLHGKVVEIDGIRVAGLGGIFREEIWYPTSLVDTPPHFESYDDYIENSEAGRILALANSSIMMSGDLEGQLAKAQGKRLKHRSTIFSQEYYELAAQEADILVTHEAPFCHPHGFRAINELAKSMRVKKCFHGHHHDNLDYQDQWEDMGFEAYGVGLRGIKDINGAVILQGELDEHRAYRTPRV